MPFSLCRKISESQEGKRALPLVMLTAHGYTGGMQRNARQQRVRAGRRSAPGPSFSYAQVETALAKVYDAVDVQQKAFQGRLKHLRKLGLPQKTPGKGARIRYTKDDVAQLLVALEFSEFGIDPHLIVDIILRDWKRKGPISQAVEHTQFQGDDWLLPIRANFMSWVWQPETETLKETAEGISVRSGRNRNPVRVFTPILASQASTFFSREPEGRFFVVNLSARVRGVEQALSAAG